MCKYYKQRGADKEKHPPSQAAVKTHDTVEAEEIAMAEELAKLESIPLKDGERSDDSFFSAAPVNLARNNLNLYGTCDRVENNNT